MFKSTNSKVSNWLLFVGVLLFSTSLYGAGYGVAKSHWANTVSNLLVALLWGGLVAIIYIDRCIDARLEGARKFAEQAEAKLEEAVAEARASKLERDGRISDREQWLRTALISLLKAVNSEKVPTKKELEAIAKMFHKTTGHTVILEPVGDVGIDASISKEPVALKPVRRRKIVPKAVIKGSKMPKKPIK